MRPKTDASSISALGKPLHGVSGLGRGKEQGGREELDEEIQLSIKIPSAIYKKDREYKMICVTKGGQPIIYNDLDSNPETITIKTNNFYAYALIYK